MSGNATLHPASSPQRTVLVGCICGQQKRANAILCRSCWFLIPLQLRSRLPFKSSDPDFERIKKLCLEYAQVTISAQAKTSVSLDRGPHERKRVSQANDQRRKRQREILREICAAQPQMPVRPGP